MFRSVNAYYIPRWSLSVIVNGRAISLCGHHTIEDMTVIYFDWLDYLVFGAMLLFSALIGVYFAFFASKKQNTTSEYLMGGKTMGMFPISMSLIARYIFYCQFNLLFIRININKLVLLCVYISFFYFVPHYNKTVYSQLHFGHIVARSTS